jgi:fibronectin type 3 domain-containing protein
MTLKSSPAVITALQTAQNYDVRVKAINELGVASTYASANQVAAIDTTAPNAPSGLSVTGHYQHNSLSWTNPTASDLNRIDVYRSTTSGGTYSVIGNTDGTVYIDDNLANDQTFFYKLKAIDFTGHASVFSGIDSATTTIIEAGDRGEDSIATVNIQDLAVATDKIDNDAVTISKIATSLQSTNYVAGTSGWKILKSGAVEFEEAIIRGTISATSGSISDTVTIGGTAASTIVAGASDGANALQDSDTDINLGLTGGTIAGITISGTKLYEGTGTFNNSNTGFYLDNTGQFSLKDKLSFDGSTLAVIGDITADNLNVTNATVTGSFVADNLPTLQNMNGVITVNQINANTITVDKLSGDVSETYPINYPSSIGVCSGSVVTNNDVRLTVPAPSGDVEKNATVSLTIKMSATNGYTSGTSTIAASCDLRLQRLSTGITTGTAIGASVVEVLSLAGNIKRLKIVGNHLDNLATIGSISRSSTGAVGFTITPVLGYYYQNTVTGYSGNFTYVFTSSSTDITVGSSFYFNKDAWQSQGVWISSENYERLYFQVQPQDTVTKDYTIHETLGKTLSGENFRLTATQYENTSGSNTPITVHNVSGTMQLIT